MPKACALQPDFPTPVSAHSCLPCAQPGPNISSGTDEPSRTLAKHMGRGVRQGKAASHSPDTHQLCDLGQITAPLGTCFLLRKMETIKTLTSWAARAVPPAPPALWAHEVSPVPEQGARWERGNSSFLAMFPWLISLPEITAKGYESAQQTGTIQAPGVYSAGPQRWRKVVPPHGGR